MKKQKECQIKFYNILFSCVISTILNFKSMNISVDKTRTRMRT